MKKYFLLGSFLVFSFYAYTQEEEYSPNFNSDGSVKHAVSLNLGATAFAVPGYYENSGPTISILYQRQFLNKHFLRGGFRLQIPGKHMYSTSVPPYQPDVHNASDPVNSSHIRFSYGTHMANNLMIGYQIGYAKHFGKHRIQPVLGVSLYLGYQRMSGLFTETSWRENKIYNPISGSSTYEIEPLTDGAVYHTDHRIFMGIIPRLGIYADMTKHLSLGVSLNPYIGYTHQLSSIKSGQSGDMPQTSGFYKDYWSGLANAEVQFVFKILPRQKASKSNN